MKLHNITFCLFLTGTVQQNLYDLVIWLVHPITYNTGKGKLICFTRWVSFCYTFLIYYILSLSRLCDESAISVHHKVHENDWYKLSSSFIDQSDAEDDIMS